MQTAARPSTHRLLNLRSDEIAGLVVALGAHVAIVVALAVHVLRDPVVIPPPERVEVSLAEDVGLESTARQISQEAQAAVAPTISDVPAPAPKPKTQQKRQTPVVNPNASAQKNRIPPAPVPTQKAGGGGRLGDDFVKGKSDGAVDADAPIPASQIGASDKASLTQAIARQLRPHWKPPSGAGAEDLVTILSFDLKPDGTLAGRPRVVSQSGVTDSNRTQAGRHQELAIRAVQLAAPFDLPPRLYNAWKHIKNSKFDWTLSQ